MDILGAADVRGIVAEFGFVERPQQSVGDVLLFHKPGADKSLEISLEAYLNNGDVAVFIPHPRQRGWRIFHLGALFTKDTLRNVLEAPMSDNAFSYHLSDVLKRMNIYQPPCTETAALERQVMLIDREIADLQRERIQLVRRLKEFDGGGRSIDLSASLNPPPPVVQPRHEDEDDTRSVYSRKAMATAEEVRMTSAASDMLISRGSGDRARGNKGVWSMFFPDAQEAFARAWSAKTVAHVALGRGFVVSYDDGTASWSDISPLLEAKLRQQGVQSTGKSAVRIRYIVLGDEGNFYVKFDNGRMEWCGQDSFGAALRRGVSERHLLVEKIAFAQEGGWLIVWSDRTFEGENIPETLEQRLGGTRLDDGRVVGIGSGIKDITLGPAGEWFVIYRDHSVQADNLPDALYKCLSQIREKTGRVRSIAFGENRSWFVRYWDGSK